MKKTRKPAMPRALLTQADAARSRARSRPGNPGVRIQGTRAEGYDFASPYRELEAWEVQICDAFGTRSTAVRHLFLSQLSDLCTPEWLDNGDWRPSELELNAAVAIVNGIRPKNEMEAALAAQMVAVHFMQMRTANRALAGGDQRAASVSGKLARTFTMQMDALGRARGKVGRQSIKVRYERHEHQHVHQHVHDERGETSFERQPVATGDGIVVALNRPVGQSRGGGTLRGEVSTNRIALPSAIGSGKD